MYFEKGGDKHEDLDVLFHTKNTEVNLLAILEQNEIRVAFDYSLKYNLYFFI